MKDYTRNFFFRYHEPKVPRATLSFKSRVRSQRAKNNLFYDENIDFCFLLPWQIVMKVKFEDFFTLLGDNSLTRTYEKLCFCVLSIELLNPQIQAKVAMGTSLINQ